MSISKFGSPRRVAAIAATGVLSLGLLTACGAGGSSQGGDGEVTTLRLASSLPETSLVGQQIQAWVDRVEELSEGSIEIEVYPSGSLLPGTEIAKGVADGRADLGFTSSNYHPAEMPLWNVVAIPYTSTNALGTAKAFQTLYEEDGAFKKGFDDFGVNVAVFLSQPSAAAAFTEPVESVSDLDGLRVRAAGTMGNVMSDAGADSIFLELVEVYESAQRGVIDGWAGVDMGTSMSFKFGEVTPHVVDLGVGQYSATGIVMSPAVYDGLAPEQQEAIDEASADFPDALADILVEGEAKACDQLADQGGSATALPEKERDELKRLTQDRVKDVVRDAAMKAGLSEDDFDHALETYTEFADYEGPEGFEDGLAACAAR